MPFSILFACRLFYNEYKKSDSVITVAPFWIRSGRRLVYVIKSKLVAEKFLRYIAPGYALPILNNVYNNICASCRFWYIVISFSLRHQ